MRKDWTPVIKKYEASGMTISAFARKIGVRPNVLGYNINKHKKNGTPKAKVASAGFVQVGAPEIIEIEKNGVLFRAPVTINEETLKRLLSAASVGDNE